MKDPDGLLMIEPRGAASAKPLLDALTRRMTAAWRAHPIDESRAFRGWHTCCCGARSDHLEPRIEGRLSNPLCVHYLAWHRKEVAEVELEKVQSLPDESAEPNLQELQPPAQHPSGKLRAWFQRWTSGMG
jgi:hypothetical protein